MTATTIEEATAQLRGLGVASGAVLLVHTSFRAVRPIEDGPAGLIEALRKALGPAGTLVMPTWTGDDDTPFDPRATPAAADLGVVAEHFRRMPGALRSDHPFAFSALGPEAEAILADPLPLPPHAPASPVGRVLERDGQILLVGVGHDSNTSLHLAEAMAGVPYAVPRHVTVLRDGRALRIDYAEPDHCCARFALADDWLRPLRLQAEGPVGRATARLMRARDLVAAARPRLAASPTLFLHPEGSGCAECDLAWRTVPDAPKRRRPLR